MIYPVPKPVRAKRTRAPLRNRKSLKRTKMRCGAGSKRRGKSSFPKQRDAKYRRWIWTENPCMLVGRCTYVRFSEHDVAFPVGGTLPRFVHYCWGANTPAHVGKHQAKGAPDFGVLVPLCKEAHRRYDERRWDWKRATGFSEKQMASAASGYALKYCEQGGSSTPRT